MEFEVQARVMLQVKAEGMEMALSLAEQALNSAMWVEAWSFSRIREVDGEGQGVDIYFIGVDGGPGMAEHERND